MTLSEDQPPRLGMIRRIKGELVRINGVFVDDEGEITSVSGTLIEPRPDGTKHVAIDMRGIPWPEKPEWLH